MASSVPFTVEDEHGGWPNEPVLYRIRVRSHPGQAIRYLRGPRSPKGASGFPDHRGEHLAFDTVPDRDWNLGHLVISGDSTREKFTLASTETAQLETVGLLDAGPTWIDKSFDLVDLLDAFYAHRESIQDDDDQDDTPRTDIQCTNQISALVLPTPAGLAAVALGPEVVGGWTWQPGHAHGISDESKTYSIIHARDPGLAPRFLAHITDNGTRVIGFLVERVASAREAGPADLERCRKTLGRLHALGIAYGGPLRRHSFLVCEDGTVLLQGFGGSFKTADKNILGGELESLEQVLAKQPSELEKCNAPINKALSNKLVEFLSHGVMHPFVHWQLENTGRVTVTVEQHRELVAELAANDYQWTEEDMERLKRRFDGPAHVETAGAASESTGRSRDTRHVCIVL